MGSADVERALWQTGDFSRHVQAMVIQKVWSRPEDPKHAECGHADST
jgi:hypothetical protein